MSPIPDDYNSDYNSDYDSDDEREEVEQESHFITPDHDCTLACECDIVNLQEEIDSAHHRIFHLENNTEDMNRMIVTLLMAINYLLHRDAVTR